MMSVIIAATKMVIASRASHFEGVSSNSSTITGTTAIRMIVRVFGRFQKPFPFTVPVL